MRIFTVFLASIYLIATGIEPVAAQYFPVQEPLGQPPPQPLDTDVAPKPNQEISPQFSRYLLGPGDGIGVLVQRPNGQYRLGQGDAISVVVQRFPDLSFQAAVNPEGNIVVPLLGTVSLQGLTLEQAQAKIRAGYNRYVVDPIVALSLVAQRPPLSFQTAISREGDIVIPQVGKVTLAGLTLEEAQEKVRLSLEGIQVDPVVTLSLLSPRPVEVTINGEIPRPGIYPLNPLTPRINEVLRFAGGTTKMADLRQIQVRRKLIDGSIISQNIDLYTPLQSGGTPPDLRLQDGDSIIVTRREIDTDDGYDRNLVARSTLAQPAIQIRFLNYPAGGIVTRSLPNGSNFVDALSGISIDRTNLREIALVRFDPERGKAVTQKLDAKKALSGDMSQNVPLQDNDVIIVGRNLIGKITNVLGTITRPFFDVNTFIRFFDDFGRNNNN